jgi:hypothetical protein
MTDDFKSFVKCPKCGKKLIVRRDNGEWHLRFGALMKRNPDGSLTKLMSSNGYPIPVIDMIVNGTISMKCYSQECREKNPDNRIFCNKGTPTQREESGSIYKNKKEGGN